jgi:hypothetical protein
MFVCARFSTLRLSRGGCARRWEAAQERRPGPWDSLHPCLTCPTGAAHAGCPGEGRFAAAEALRGICTRCARPASRGLSGRMVWDRFCISCYNRHREALEGRNAKGTRPGLVLRDMALEVEGDGVVRRVRHDQAVSAAEAMLAEARRAGGPLAFLGAPPRPAEDGWGLVPHVCRFCLGRVLEHAGIFRCSDCGLQGGTAPGEICGCGLQVAEPPVRRQGLFRCSPREACGSSVSAEVVIMFGDGAGGNC